MRWKAWLRPLFGVKRTLPITRSRDAFRCIPMFEALEDRLAPAAFTVMNFNDAGPGSLRAAILYANNTAVADVITFAPALVGKTILLTTGELLITKPLTIAGLGAAKLTIDGNNASRIFNVDDGMDAQIAVSIFGLTVTHGNTSNYGGGIRNAELLLLTGCWLDHNSGMTDGGGIHNLGTLTLTSSIVSNNGASGSAFSRGRSSITPSTPRPPSSVQRSTTT